jgi:hypothetical protein
MTHSKLRVEVRGPYILVALRGTCLRAVRRIGPVYAKKLVRAFAEEVFDIIEVAPSACAS